MGMGAPAPTSASTPAASVDPLGDLMGMAAPAAPPPPMNAAGSSAAAATLVAFSKDGVEVSFECTKPDVTDHSLTTVVATTRNLGGTPMTGYVLQCAVPKAMSLAMRTASGGELPVGGVVTQRLDVTNSQHGEKALAMRLRLAWNAGGAGDRQLPGGVMTHASGDVDRIKILNSLNRVSRRGRFHWKTEMQKVKQRL